MKLKVSVDETGNGYVALIDPSTKEHKKAAAVNTGQEIELALSSVTSESQVDFGEVTDSGKPEAAGSAEEGAGEGEGAEGGEEPAQPTGEPETPAGAPEDGAQGEVPAGLGIARAVIYRSKTGNYDLPAVVTATVATLDPEGVRLGHVPELDSPDRVHLTVFTCGKQGSSRDGNPVNNEAAGGSYQEFNIPQFVCEEVAREDEGQEPEPGSWRWPERV